MKVPCPFLWYSGSSFSENFLYLSSCHSFWETFPTHSPRTSQDLPGGPLVKNPPANAADIRDTDSIPGSGRSPGHGNPLQDSCLENSMDRAVWWAAVHGVANSRTQLSDWAGMHARAMEYYSAKGFHIHKHTLSPACVGSFSLALSLYPPPSLPRTQAGMFLHSLFFFGDGFSRYLLNKIEL